VARIEGRSAHLPPGTLDSFLKSCKTEDSSKLAGTIYGKPFHD